MIEWNIPERSEEKDFAIDLLNELSASLVEDTDGKLGGLTNVRLGENWETIYEFDIVHSGGNRFRIFEITQPPLMYYLFDLRVLYYRKTETHNTVKSAELRAALLKAVSSDEMAGLLGMLLSIE